MSDFSLPIVPRYAEVDQQGVVFNSHYLTWFDEAVTGLFDHIGVGPQDFTESGHDFQLVHTEIDYLMPVRWRDDVRVTAFCERIGTTSFTIGFNVLRRRSADAAVEQIAASGHNVYVLVATCDWAKRPLPAPLRDALKATHGASAKDAVRLS